MQDYLKATWWTNFNWELYFRILQAKAKRENLL